MMEERPEDDEGVEDLFCICAAKFYPHRLQRSLDSMIVLNVKLGTSVSSCFDRRTAPFEYHRVDEMFAQAQFWIPAVLFERL
ncbi:hypothetical protein CDAR_81281 [Caerostris darwini]|uniref:Uncharacterized protein n=1 Tax=Caerostris darwini TaxID=1538125 RepID=A0AAV4MGB6_9ARAC|nr:hypothetical protein CDAR_81281 [Caerostris darwini]